MRWTPLYAGPTGPIGRMGRIGQIGLVWSDTKRESSLLAPANWDSSLPAGYVRRIETSS
jgi:hypothetical protein